MTKYRKGQAAMEFLMTYGWAILAAIIVIAALAAFGVFSPSTYIPNTCSLSAPFGCVAGTADDTDGVKLELRNGAGDTLNVTGLSISGCTSGSLTPDVSNGYSMADQNVTLFTMSCGADLDSGEKFRGDLTITYTKSGSTLPQTSTGELVDEA